MWHASVSMQGGGCRRGVPSPAGGGVWGIQVVAYWCILRTKMFLFFKVVVDFIINKVSSIPRVS